MSKDLAIAIDLGASNLRVALISQKGFILKKIQEKTASKGKSGKVVTEQILGLVTFLLENIEKKRILGIGVSSIGPLDYKRGRVVHPPNLPFKYIPLLTPLKTMFSLPALLFKDCNAAVWGEKHFGAGKNVENLVYITISTGIGGGTIVDGHLLHGNQGNAAEIGHMIIESKYQVKCGCKRKNHWEAYASGRNIPKFFKEWQRVQRMKRQFMDLKAGDIFEMAKKGDQIACRFLKELGKINAKAVSNVIVAFAPELITFGGPVVLNNEDLILEPIKKQMEDYILRPKIKKTPLLEDASLLGAGASVFWPPI